MKTNRLVTRGEATALDFATRIKIESQITDAKRGTIKRVVIPAGWTFDDYRSRSPWRRYLFKLLGPIEDKIILDLGCGYHPTPIYFALAGAKRVYACDVSPQAVSFQQNLAEEYGVSDTVLATVCASEDLPYDDEQFDLIHGEAVLHHLQLDAAGREIARVLKTGGKAGFKDPLGQNPLIEFARDYVPYRGKNDAKGTDRPLTFPDIRTFGRNFSACSYRGLGLTSSIVVMFYGRRRNRLTRVLDALDTRLFSAFPFLHRYGRFVVTTVQK